MKKLIFNFSLSIFLINFVVAHAGEEEYSHHSMMSGFGMGFFGWLFITLIIITLVLLIVWLIKQIQKK